MVRSVMHREFFALWLDTLSHCVCHPFLSAAVVPADIREKFIQFFYDRQDPASGLFIDKQGVANAREQARNQDSGLGACGKLGKCIVDDVLNQFIPDITEADGLVFGSPVHYAAPSGAITAFMDRLFYSSSKKLAGKPACAVFSCRRGGATASFDVLNKYFTISSMPIVSGQYWNMVHGQTPAQVEEDLEGLQVMRSLGKNMSWLLKCIEAGKKQGIDFPEKEPPLRTNFIR